MKYTVILEQGENSWGAYVPDVGGCIAVGDTREEVERLITEALAFHFEGMAEEGLPIPAPGTWTTVVDVPLPEGAVAAAEVSEAHGGGR